MERIKTNSINSDDHGSSSSDHGSSLGVGSVGDQEPRTPKQQKVVKIVHKNNNNNSSASPDTDRDDENPITFAGSPPSTNDNNNNLPPKNDEASEQQDDIEGNHSSSAVSLGETDPSPSRGSFIIPSTSSTMAANNNNNNNNNSNSENIPPSSTTLPHLLSSSSLPQQQNQSQQQKYKTHSYNVTTTTSPCINNNTNSEENKHEEEEAEEDEKSVGASPSSTAASTSKKKKKVVTVIKKKKSSTNDSSSTTAESPSYLSQSKIERHNDKHRSNKNKNDEEEEDGDHSSDLGSTLSATSSTMSSTISTNHDGTVSVERISSGVTGSDIVIIKARKKATATNSTTPHQSLSRTHSGMGSNNHNNNIQTSPPPPSSSSAKNSTDAVLEAFGIAERLRNTTRNEETSHHLSVSARRNHNNNDELPTTSSLTSNGSFTSPNRFTTVSASRNRPLASTHSGQNMITTPRNLIPNHTHAEDISPTTSSSSAEAALITPTKRKEPKVVVVSKKSSKKENVTTSPSSEQKKNQNDDDDDAARSISRNSNSTQLSLAEQATQFVTEYKRKQQEEIDRERKIQKEEDEIFERNYQEYQRQKSEASLASSSVITPPNTNDVNETHVTIVPPHLSPSPPANHHHHHNNFDGVGTESVQSHSGSTNNEINSSFANSSTISPCPSSRYGRQSNVTGGSGTKKQKTVVVIKKKKNGVIEETVHKGEDAANLMESVRRKQQERKGNNGNQIDDDQATATPSASARKNVIDSALNSPNSKVKIVSKKKSDLLKKQNEATNANEIEDNDEDERQRSTSRRGEAITTEAERAIVKAIDEVEGVDKENSLNLNLLLDNQQQQGSSKPSAKNSNMINVSGVVSRTNSGLDTKDCVVSALSTPDTVGLSECHPVKKDLNSMLDDHEKEDHEKKVPVVHEEEEKLHKFNNFAAKYFLETVRKGGMKRMMTLNDKNMKFLKNPFVDSNQSVRLNMKC